MSSSFSFIVLSQEIFFFDWELELVLAIKGSLVRGIWGAFGEEMIFEAGRGGYGGWFLLTRSLIILYIGVGIGLIVPFE